MEKTLFYDYLELHAEKTPKKCAFRFLENGDQETEVIDFRGLASYAKQIASYIEARLIKSHSVHIALLLFPSGIDFISTFLACQYCGVIAVPISLPRKVRTLERLKAILKDSGAQYILSNQKIQRAFSDSDLLKNPEYRWIVIPPIGSEVELPESRWVRNQALSFLQYTSGSTSSPKGVMVSSKNLIANNEMIRDSFQHDFSTIMGGWLPLYHDMGLIGLVLHPIFMGISSILMPPVAFLQKPIRWLRAITKYKITTSGGPNFAYDLCCEKISEEEKVSLDLSNWRVAFNGSEPVSEKTLNLFFTSFRRQGFKKRSSFPCYGLAEGTLFISGDSPLFPPSIYKADRHALEQKGKLKKRAKNKPFLPLVRLGKVDKNNAIVIVDPQNHFIKPLGEEGEIWLSGAHVAQGYWSRKEESKKTFSAKIKGQKKRFLRTGDLGVLDEKGFLYVTGRLKELIILRGRNLYPQDIEQAVAEVSSSIVKNGVAAFGTRAGEEERLIIIAEIKRTDRKLFNSRQLKELIREKIYSEHEVTPHEIIFILQNALPKTSSGKIQRLFCKEKFLNNSFEHLGQKSTDLISPFQEGEKKPLEQALFKILEQNVDVLSYDLPMKNLGLDSIKTIQIQQLLYEKWGMKIEPYSLIEDLSISDLLQRTKTSRLENTSSTTLSKETFPLSIQQSDLYKFQQIYPESSAYNIGVAIRLLSPVTYTNINAAFQKLLERHPILRSTICSSNMQKIKHFQNVSTESVHLESEKEIIRFLQKESKKPFNLKNSPLFRMFFIQSSQKLQVLALITHHSISDLWSFSLLIRELFSILGEKPLLTKTLPYSHYVELQRQFIESKKFTKSLDYWSHQFLMKTDRLFIRFPRPKIQSFSGKSFYQKIGETHRNLLKKQAAAMGVTPYAALLAIYYVFLVKVHHVSNVIFGTTISGRNSPDFYNTTGFFSNIMPILHNEPLSSSFLDLAQNMQALFKENEKHLTLPFSFFLENLQKKGLLQRDPTYPPVFQTMFVLQSVPTLSKEENTLILPADTTETVKYGNIKASSFPWRPETALYDLVLFMVETPKGYTGCWEYNEDLFDQESIQKFAQIYHEVFIQSLTFPESKLSELTKEKASGKWYIGKTTSFSKKSIPEQFGLICEKYSDATALIVGSHSISYSKLQELITSYSQILSEKGVGPGSVIALSMERSAELVIAIFAILQLGAAFVPIDSEIPYARKKSILKECSPSLLLLLGEKEQEKFSLPIFLVPKIDSLPKAPHLKVYSPKVQSNFLAYIIYTSGSTGSPKGVMISHGALSNYLANAIKEYKLSKNSFFACFTSISFDLTLTSLFAPLFCGGTAVIFPSMEDTESLFKHLLSHPLLTHLKATPSHLRAFNAIGRLPSKLKFLIVGGESLSSNIANQTLSLIKNRVLFLVNEYGPTEATIGCITETLSSICEEKVVPIGHPISNMEAYITDGSQELLLGGAGLAYGYWRSGKKTATFFLPHPKGIGERLYKTGDIVKVNDRSSLVFVKRKDRQVKLRGYRIELEEIELSLQKHPMVDSAVVTIKKIKEPTLCAYYIPKKQGLLQKRQLKAFLQDLLPEYMVPSHFIEYQKFPLTENGKINFTALKIPSTNSALHKDIQSPEEKFLRKVWAELFLIQEEEISATSQFFALGGDSIKALELVALLEKNQYRIQTKDVFENPLIKDLSKKLKPLENFSTLKHKRNTKEKTFFSLAPIQEEFLKKEEKNPHYYNQAMVLDMRTFLSEQNIQAALNALFSAHPMLRARFTADHYTLNGQWKFGSTRIKTEEFSESFIKNLLETLHRDLHIFQGPLVNIHLVTSDKKTKLFIVIHHLLIDGISWNVFCEDLDAFLSACKEKKKWPILQNFSSYDEWVDSLQEPSLTTLDFWEKIHQSYEAHRQDFSPFTLSNRNLLKRSLKTFFPPSLAAHSFQMYNLELGHLLLAFFILSLREANIEGSSILHYESHGRFSSKDLSLSRTIGWFTEIYPLLIGNLTTLDLESCITFLKSTFEKRAPHQAGYRSIRKKLGTIPSPICFNFLGNFITDRFENFSMNPIFEGLSDPQNSSPYFLEFHLAILDERLQLFCFWDTTALQYAKIEHFLDCFASFITSFSKKAATLPVFSKHVPPHVKSAFYSLSETPKASKIFPITPTEREMLLEVVKNPKSSLYQETLKFKIEGTFSPSFLEKQTIRLAKKYDSFRSRFLFQYLPEPLCLISEKADNLFTLYDLTSLNKGEKAEKIDSIEQQIENRHFTLSEEPLLAIYLVRLSKDEAWCYWKYHHIIMDGWSLSIALRDWLGAIKGDLQFNREDYLQLLYSKSEEKAERYWQNYLKDYQNVESLVSKGRPTRDIQELSFVIDPIDWKKIQSLASRHLVTTNLVLQALWSILLKTYTQSDDIAFGFVNSGRDFQVPSIRDAVGLFIKTLPCRVQFTTIKTLKELIFSLKKDQISREEHGFFPLSAMQKLTRSEGSFLETLFVYENYPFAEEAENLRSALDLPFTLKDFFFKESIPFPLCVAFFPSATSHSKGVFQYDTGSFSHDMIQHMMRGFQSLIAFFLEHPEESISSYEDVLRPSKDFFAPKDTSKDYKAISSVIEAFDEIVLQNPERIAIVEGENYFSYDFLAQESIQLAKYLQTLNLQPEDEVAVFLPRSSDLLIAFIGILKAGGCYMPLDIHAPKEKTESILRKARPKFLITIQDFKDSFPYFLGQTVQIDLERTKIRSCKAPIRKVPYENGKLLAYVLHTSGTTGNPKGIAVEHHSLLNHFFWTKEHLSINQSTKMLQFTTPSFDVSLCEFSVLYGGGTLCIAPDKTKQDLTAFLDLIKKLRITHLQLVPSFLRLLLESDDVKELCFIQHILCGAETLSLKDAQKIQNKLSAPITNLYGLTETCIDSTAFPIPQDVSSLSSIPIGKPILNTEVYVLDSNMALLPPYTKGMLFIGGSGLARGYHRDPALSAKCFLPNPFRPSERLYASGDIAFIGKEHNIEFIGRKDHQVKIRGFRVELAEVEKTLLHYDFIDEVYMDWDKKQEQLAAYFRARKAINSTTLREKLLRVLPHYAIPSQLIQVEKIPVTQTGKVDISALRKLLVTQEKDLSAQSGKSTNSTDIIIKIWSDVLNLSPSLIGLHRSFFELGGDSLKLMNAHYKITKELKKDISINVLFEYPTIQSLANYLEGNSELFDSGPIDWKIRQEKKRQRRRALERE